MKKTVFITLSSILLLTLISIWGFKTYFPIRRDPPPAVLGLNQQANPVHPLPSESKIIVSTPKRLIIPKIGINSVIEEVGVDNEDKMDVPKVAENVGWYNLGAKPGEIGNAVIDGHLDKKNGSPAIFYNLNKLATDDILQIQDQNGQIITFKVTDIKSYKLDEFPLSKVFGDGQTARLNLVTCEGVFNSKSNLYSHRLVVYSQRVN